MSATAGVPQTTPRHRLTRVSWAKGAAIGRRPDTALIALLVLGAILRLSTLGHQSFWYDEAYTPVHVLHRGLGATLRSVVHTENSPPLWYVLEWAISRVLGTGVVALRLLSALAGVATVGVAWAIGRELGRRRTAITLAAILAVNPLLVWYAQEARDYSLFACLSALSLLCFLRAARAPSGRALAWWAVSSILALLTHYFAAFLVGPEALLLLAARFWSLPGRLGRGERTAMGPLLVAVGALVVCALALVPLVVSQGGHGTQWIGRWALSSRVVAIPGYFLLGGQSSVFGHGVLLLCALPVLVSVGLLTGLEPEEWRDGVLVLVLGGVSMLIPFGLVLLGADYLAPRNLIASWIPLSAALALLLSARRAGRAGLVLSALVCAAGLAVVLAIDFAPRFQRGDWHGVAAALGKAAPERAVVVVELGAAPLEYYQPALRYVAPGHTLQVSEVDVIGYRPLRAGASRPPTPAFRLVRRSSVHGLLIYRFLATSPQTLSERNLRQRRLTATRSEVLAPATVSAGPASAVGLPVP